MNTIFLQSNPYINWDAILFGQDDAKFLVEIAVRSTLMFLIIVVALRMLGKRGVTQLSVFELIVILSLGSAAGDAMFYKDVGLLPSAAVFAIVILLYKTIIYAMGKSQTFESLMEGDPVYLIKKGEFNVEEFNKEQLAHDEFFSELRMRGITHLGQIDQAIIETNGQLSLFFFPDEKVRYGLPVLPEEFKVKYKEIPAAGTYSCANCGNTEELELGANVCQDCQKSSWVKSMNDRRVV